jgi:hypothetical protein
LAYNPDKGIFYAYRESLEGELTTKEHVQRAMGYAMAENVLQWTGGAPSEKQQRWDWYSEGVNVVQPYITDVESGIDKVIQLIKSKRLYVFNALTGLIDELGRYSRELDERGQPTEKIQDKESFHRLDALRYVVIGLDTPQDTIITYDSRVNISPF